MASSLDFVTYVCEQMNFVSEITYKKMFGEYGIYCKDKIFGLICDNQVFIKPTDAAEFMLPNAARVSPYAGAKPYILLEDLEDKEFLKLLIYSTYDQLPIPKTRKK